MADAEGTCSTAEPQSPAAEQDWHCQEKKTHRAQPSAESTSLVQDVNTLRTDCHQLRFFPLPCNLAGPSWSYIIKPLFSC